MPEPRGLVPSRAVAEALMQVHGPAKIGVLPFPGDLKNRYQHFTEADIAGCVRLGTRLRYEPRRWRSPDL